MMSWVKGLPVGDLPPGSRQTVTVDEHDVLLINHEGEIYAVGNQCPHMGARLKNGEVTESGTIVCPRHRSVFDLQNGEVEDWAPWPPVVGRALGAVSEERPLPVFTTKIEDGVIWIGTEDAE